MTKKILLIPIALMSCVVAGCEYDTYVVLLRDWLDLNGPVSSAPYFKVYNPDEEKTGGFTDYEDYVRTKMKSKTVAAEQVSKNIPKSIVTESYVELDISCHIKQMEHCQIKVFENGYVSTYAYTNRNIISSFLGAPKDQRVTYKISEAEAKEIIELATARYVEIKETIKIEQAELEESAKIENVLKEFEEAENTPKLWYGGDISSNVFHGLIFPDTNREFLPELKAVTYEEAEDEFIYEKNRIENATYRIDDNMVFSLYNHIMQDQEINLDLVSIRVRDNTKYPKSTFLYKYYKIDPEVGLQLLYKIDSLYRDWRLGQTNGD